MGNGAERPQVAKPVADDLEPYRRLIEIQKQLVEMSKQHEQTRRECDALREQLTRAMIESLPWRGKLRHHLRQSAAKLFQRPQRLDSTSPLQSLDQNTPFSC
jgi:hypothetical protein